MRISQKLTHQATKPVQYRRVLKHDERVKRGDGLGVLQRDKCALTVAACMLDHAEITQQHWAEGGRK